MKDFKSQFTTAALSTLLLLGIQQSYFADYKPKVAIANINKSRIQQPQSDSEFNKIEIIDTTMQQQILTDKALIKQLTQKWVDTWSPKDKQFTGVGLEEIFATGENEILVFDNFDSGIVVLRSLQEYLNTWVPVMQNFSYWEIKLEDNLEISVDGDLAVTTFSWVGGGKSKDGQEVKARQYGTHTWKRLNGEWRLVHEHLTVG
ncbi:MAG: nuclear transport factor 2 family protein [Cyanobacteria bacterium J06635_10]